MPDNIVPNRSPRPDAASAVPLPRIAHQPSPHLLISSLVQTRGEDFIDKGLLGLPFHVNQESGHVSFPPRAAAQFILLP